LGALPDDTWDAVVDCCGYVPRVVRQSAEHLKDRVERYLFVSTISVYADAGVTHQNEASATAVLQDPAVEEITGETYGGLKALCESEVRNTYGERALIIRPGLIAGPWDPTNRFTYWPDRFARGGKLLAPPRPSQPLQIIDARDLTEFMLSELEAGHSGTVNVTGPSENSTWADMLKVLGSLWPSGEAVNASEAFLQEHGVTLWQELPLCLPEADASDGMMRVSIEKALSRGLKLRQWAETARDTHAWSQANPPINARHGLDADKERQVLEKLSA
jgi:2'-hydroxyisoflavone reductase